MKQIVISNMIKENKKNIWLMGGLGNVIFQLYAKYIYEKKFNVECCVVESLIQKNTLTRIKKWSIHPAEYRKMFAANVVKKFFLWPIIAYLMKKLRVSRFKKVAFLEGVEELTIETEIFGYFQNKAYLEESACYLDGFRETFKKVVAPSYSAVIHFRMGDSVVARNNFEYYLCVKKIISEDKLNRYCIITDSRADAETFFDGVMNVYFHNSQSVAEDFSILANSELLIVAPSTFSWWAAHLSNSVNKIVMPQLIYNELGFIRKNIELVVL